MKIQSTVDGELRSFEFKQGLDAMIAVQAVDSQCPSKLGGEHGVFPGGKLFARYQHVRSVAIHPPLRLDRQLHFVQAAGVDLPSEFRRFHLADRKRMHPKIVSV